MKWLGRNQASPIGIDLGSRAIKAVQMRFGGGREPMVIASAALLRKDSEAPIAIEDITRLAQVLSRRGFRGSDVVLAAPANRLESDMLELPARASGAPVDELASAEIARSAKLDAGAYEAACWDVPVARSGAGAGTSVLAVALRHEDAEALIAPFDLAGLKVRAIEPASCALARALEYSAKKSGDGAGANERSIVALLDLGWHAGTVNLISDGQVLYQRALFECGVGPLYRQLAEKHGLDEEAADVVLCDTSAPEAAGAVVSSLIQAFVAQVAEEVSASLAFARHRYSGRKVNQAVLVGGGSKIRGLAGAMAGAIELPVEVLGAPDGAGAGAGDGEWAQLALAVGLALHREEA